ncbi:hypothetical protein [Actinomycetospora sp. TBRC 11914]|uniref:hypothetical protein n=1 Tax=Actinomycetospora sp. TBRC 11914 TaxID=2729387 RepID=UPI00145F4C2F|nr:hypothetical protein [Actinomycetospora sp. TBRC 11914]NMO93588.1 hypothetical protein [Actinomycetospora sp. TBRC 11914]
MDGVVLGIVAAAVVVVLLGVVLLLVARRRARGSTAALRSRFGAEYDRVVRSYGRRNGEKELRARLRRRRRLDLRDLVPDERERYSRAWETAQATFVENPSTGLRDADLLVQQVMRDRGYPSERFEEREKLVSVDHPDLVEHFRSAHEVAVADERDEQRLEDRRQAMVDHRYLFDALLQGGDAERTRRL